MLLAQPAFSISDKITRHQTYLYFERACWSVWELFSSSSYIRKKNMYIKYEEWENADCKRNWEKGREMSMQTNGFKHMLSCLYSWWGWREEYQRGRKEKGVGRSEDSTGSLVYSQSDIQFGEENNAH